MPDPPRSVPAMSGVATSITAFVGRALSGPVNLPVTIFSFGDYERMFGGLWNESTMSYAVYHYFLNGGMQAIVVRLINGDENRPLTSAQVEGSEIEKRGLFALDGADLFNLLVIPPPAPDVDVPVSTWSVARSYCEKRRAILLVDAPMSWTSVEAVVNGIGDVREGGYGTLRGRNMALYAPGIVAADPLAAGGSRIFAAGGAVAGTIARNDAERGFWKSPAGLDARLAGVLAPATQFTDEEADQLDSLGINVIRSMPAAGTLLQGARTLSGTDTPIAEWSHLSVRRMELHIEESLLRGLQWTIFESNGPALWREIKGSVSAFLERLFRLGAFHGASASEAYFVKCDGETTTRDDIDRGVINIVVGFAPMRPAEFVIIDIQQMAG